MDIDSGRFFQKHGIVPNEQFSAMDIQATYAMVDAGMGISITNRINSLTGFSGICHREIIPTENMGLWQGTVAGGRKVSGICEGQIAGTGLRSCIFGSILCRLRVKIAEIGCFSGQHVIIEALLPVDVVHGFL